MPNPPKWAKLKPGVSLTLDKSRGQRHVEYATLEWVDWFNNRRLLEPIGNIPPAKVEANFYAALETEDMAA